MCPYVEIPRQFSLTIARWLTNVYDAGNPIGISTTTGDVTGRLSATIDTGQILSESAAAVRAAQRWPAHASLIDRARRSRSGENIGFDVTDAREATSLVDLIAADYPIADSQLAP